MSDPANNDELPVPASSVTAPSEADSSVPVSIPPPTGTGALNLWTLWKFYAPLAASNAMMTVSHAIINGSLNRTSQPERSVAAYALSNSIAVLAESPMVMLRQTGAALVRDRQGWLAYVRTALVAGFIDQLLCLAIAWTPLAHVVIRGWLGAKEELFPAAVDVFRIALFVSLFSALRSIFHTVLLVKHKTLWITLGTGLRLVTMIGLAALFVQTGWFDNGVRGGIIFLAGMAVESLAAFGSFRKWYRSLPEKPPAASPQKPLTSSRVALFYLPLLVAALTGSLGMSVVNGGLSRLSNPQSIIATAAIAGVITYLFMGPLFMMHQVSLFFSAPVSAPRGDPRDRVVRWFCVQVAVISSVLLGLLAWSPLGDWLLTHAFQAPPPLLPHIKEVLRFSMFLPLIAIWNEYRNGKLLAAGQSRMLTLSKLCNIGVLVMVVAMLVKFAPWLGARVSPLSSFCALSTEQLILYLITCRLRKG